MVRVNLIDPRALADQHLVAEYNEILMLLGYVRRHPRAAGIPPQYCLGPGHIRFFKDKLLYLKERHALIRDEMRRRGFTARRAISLEEFPRNLHGNWAPSPADIRLIKDRLIWKIEAKPGYYRYEGRVRATASLVRQVAHARPPAAQGRGSRGRSRPSRTA